MSGILGVWNRSGEPVSADVLERMAKTLAHRGTDAYNTWIEGPLGFACHLNRITPESAHEHQPAHAAGLTIVFDGRLDNRPEILAGLKLQSPQEASLPDPELLLLAYRKYGENFPEKLKGDFALALFDDKAKVLLLARDAVGVRPLYYTTAGRSLLFASEIKALLAHPAVKTSPDEDMLAGILNSYVDPEKTFFKGIGVVLPGYRLRVTLDRIQKMESWDFDRVKPIRYGSFQDYAEHFRILFEQAVTRRMRTPHPATVTVSGGLDSSSIFCTGYSLMAKGAALCPSLHGVSHISDEGTPSDEKSFLLEIEKKYPVTIERLPMGPHGILKGPCREAIWHIETPLLDEQWVNSQNLFARVRQTGARVMLTGHWGDQFMADLGYLVDFFREGRWNLVSHHLREFSRWMTDADPKQFGRRFLTDAIRFQLPDFTRPFARRFNGRRYAPWYSESLRKRARACDLGRPVLKKKLPSMNARSLYETLRRGMPVQSIEWENKVANMHGLEIAFPFLDQDVLSFLIAIPGEFINYQGVPKGILREALRRYLPAPIADRKWKADFSHLVNQGLKADFDTLVHYLNTGKHVINSGYFDTQRLQQEIETIFKDFSGSACNSAWALTDLYGLELWLEIFFGNGHNVPKFTHSLTSAREGLS